MLRGVCCETFFQRSGELVKRAIPPMDCDTHFGSVSYLVSRHKLLQQSCAVAGCGGVGLKKSISAGEFIRQLSASCKV